MPNKLKKNIKNHIAKKNPELERIQIRLKIVMKYTQKYENEQIRLIAGKKIQKNMIKNNRNPLGGECHLNMT